MQVTTKYSIGDTAYYTIFATATIYNVTVLNIYMRQNIIYYDLMRQNSNFILEDVPEIEVLSFIEAKNKLKAYLETKLSELNSLVAP